MKNLSLLAILLLFLGAAACAPAYKPMHRQTNAHSFDESAGGGGASEKGFREFEKGFYSFVKAQNCVKCHGSVVNPMFAASDARAAYANAKTRVDFNAPLNSKFIAYAGNGHCGDVACSNPANGPVMQEHLEAWAAAELDVADPTDPTPAANKFVTAAVNFPANIPTLAAANPAVIRFQLSQLAPAVPALANAILELEVHMANPTTYRMNRPKIVGNTAPVSLDGIHIFIKPAAMAGLGIEDPNGAAWSAIAVTANIAPRPATLPTTPLAATPLRTNAIFMGMQSAADAVTVVLDNVR